MASTMDKINAVNPSASSVYGKVNDTIGTAKKTTAQSGATGFNSVLNSVPTSSTNTTAAKATTTGTTGTNAITDNNSNMSKLASYYTSMYGNTGFNPYNFTGTETAAEETAAEEAASTNPAQTAQQYLNDYNTNREQKIRDLYTSNLASTNAAQKTALDASEANVRNAYQQNLASMRNAYEQNLSDAEAARAQISPAYQQSMNALSAQYERQRRNNNMQAAANGLNTGAGSQMALAQSASYLGNQGNLARSENEALVEADRGIGDLNRDYTNRSSNLEMQYNNSLADLRTNYQNKIAEAAANNDYQLAAALLDEYGAQYDRTVSQAAQLAEYGDFSMYASIYGEEAAKQMEKNWALQNPVLAYNLGKLTEEEYYNMTGSYPNGSSGISGILNIGTTPSYSSSRSSGRGYSASRDRAYRGPAGYYDGYGNFIVNNSDGSVNHTYSAGSAEYESDAGLGSYGTSMTQNQKDWYAENR